MAVKWVRINETWYYTNLEDQRRILGPLGAERIGLALSEAFQLHPEQSTSALVLHHPQAKYFSV